VIDDRLAECDAVPAGAAWGRVSIFQSSQLIVFDHRAHVRLAACPRARSAPVHVGQRVYHFIDARRRPPMHVDDFSHWLQGWGPTALPAVSRLEAIDPIFWSLSELRELIAQSLELVPRAQEVA